MPARQPARTTRPSTSAASRSSDRARSEAPARPAKGSKRDGTPKVRWTAAERSDRGRPPRRSSGRAFGDVDPRRDGDARRSSGPARGGDSRPARSTAAEPRSAQRGRPADRPSSDLRGYGRPTSDRAYDRRTSDRATFDRPSINPSAAPSPPQPTRSFGELGLPASLVTDLAGRGITEAFPIQAATIPDALRGRDILGRARTGSGKTLAFALPILARLTGRNDSRVGAMILVPTRELAMQACDAIAPLARTVGLSTVLVAGGMPYAPQLRAFERGVDIVVATPGRLIDLLERGAADLSRVEVAVLDEADHMADLGFTPEVRTLLDAIPGGGQRLLFSATLDRAVDALVRDYLAEPLTHQVDSDQASVETMEHHMLHVLPKDKAGVTAELAARDGRTVVFARSQLGVERTAEELRSAGILAGALHGGLGQGQRNRVLAAFRSGQLPVLVATDVAARGIHVDDISLVVQADPPNGPKEYLHRAGRTARAGADGVVVTLILPHQRRTVSRLAAEAGVATDPIRTEPGDQALARATGARTPSGEPVSTATYERLIAPPARTDRGRGRARRPGDRSGPRQRRDR